MGPLQSRHVNEINFSLGVTKRRKRRPNKGSRKVCCDSETCRNSRLGHQHLPASIGLAPRD
jgi:hypothetical protein